jgi:hypothetical protein
MLDVTCVRCSRDDIDWNDLVTSDPQPEPPV